MKAYPGTCSEDGEDPNMALFDWFAGQALAGYLADPDWNHNWAKTAQIAYDQASAMMEERHRRNFL